MKKIVLKTFAILSIGLIASCSQSCNSSKDNLVEAKKQNCSTKKEPHRYGGWYCPDNLNGFPPVDIANWKNVPVVNGRMPTKEETQNGTSLIFVDLEKYPNAKPLGITMPKLASIFNHSSNREELIIVIQAVNIDNDSIVGFRYLNGGNGSGRLNDVKFITYKEIEDMPQFRFLTQSIKIKASQDSIWKVLTHPEYSKSLREICGENYTSSVYVAKNVNYHFENSGTLTASYADKLYGNFYIQNDYQRYNEKFFLSEDQETKETELKIVAGPFGHEFDVQKSILNKWAQKVKELSENRED